MTHQHSKSTRFASFLLMADLVCLSATMTNAQVVSSFVGVSGDGLASMSFNNLGTPSPGNDNFLGTSPNWIAVHQKAYDSIGVIDMVFSVDNVGIPTTEYIFTEGVDNGTGIPWTDYHLELGFGTGAGFVISPPGDGLDFDSPDLDSPFTFAPFTTVVIGEDTIDCYDGVFPAGMFMNFTFPFDVPAGITEFTIRQYPTVEPVATELKSWGAVKALY